MGFFWPEIEDEDQAKKACHQAAGLAFFIATVTGLVVWLQTSGKIDLFPGLGLEALLDACLFFIIGIGLIFKSRIAAVAGFLLFVAERVFMIATYGVNPGQLIIGVLFALAFLSGIRGAFRWHGVHQKTDEKQPAGPQPVQWGKIIFRLLLVAGVVTAGYFFLKKNPEIQQKLSAINPDDLKEKVQVLSSKVTDIKKDMSAAAELTGPGVRTFRLYNGRKIRGRVLEDDAVYYRLDIGGGREEILIKNDITAEETVTEAAPAPK